jgi:hypothetical protein
MRSAKDTSVTTHCHAATAQLTREYQSDHRRQSLTSTAASATRGLPHGQLTGHRSWCPQSEKAGWRRTGRQGYPAALYRAALTASTVPRNQTFDNSFHIMSLFQ